jgi:hypothetical protein
MPWAHRNHGGRPSCAACGNHDFRSDPCSDQEFEFPPDRHIFSNYHVLFGRGAASRSGRCVIARIPFLERLCEIQPSS